MDGRGLLPLLRSQGRTLLPSGPGHNVLEGVPNHLRLQHTRCIQRPIVVVCLSRCITASENGPAGIPAIDKVSLTATTAVQRHSLHPQGSDEQDWWT